ncbi:MAG: alkaline phosphatase D family protein [Parvularculaceae bacterium]|nr:alkaline phosphatase D family protein [Parvularculaceae bacterium]
MTKLTRRGAIGAAVLGGAAACAPRAPQKTPYASPTGTAEGAFQHGVASGDPARDGVVLWTRIAPPADGSAVDVRWQVAPGEDFASIAAEGVATTGPERDYTVKAVAGGLAPGRAYFYRFLAGDVVSPVGRTRTLADGALASARFAVVSCSNYPFGYFNVYDRIARETGFDAVLHLGDYIYEYGVDGYGGPQGEKIGRPHAPAHEILTLGDYRARHAQYKADAASRAMHAAHPLIPIWDDHEVANDSWSEGAENHDPATEGEYAARKRAALQAYFEWMPVREPDAGAGREAFFRVFSYGDLLTLVALETRLMARSKQIPYDEVVPTLTSPEAVQKFKDEVIWAPSREMMGRAQLDFVRGALKTSVDAGQPWRVLANQVIMAAVTAPDLTSRVTEEDLAALEKQWDQARAFVKFSAFGLPTNLDAWDGYPAARERLYQAARDVGSNGLLVVTGDTHTWWANDLVAKDGARMGVELGVHSVTSPSPYNKNFLGGKGAEYALLTNRENKSVRYLSGEDHGYVDLFVERDKATARFVAVDTIESPSYGAFEKAAFTIRGGGDAPRFVGAHGLSLKERALFG